MPPTTHLRARIALAPARLRPSATRESVRTALAAHRHVLVIGPPNPATGKADGISLDLFRCLRVWCPGVCILNEADGSRMRPFKAPAEHEPVIPEETTLVVPVVGADIFGRTLAASASPCGSSAR
jgi:probable selenium-dependent hydroxylase accessory protein YqeC